MTDAHDDKFRLIKEFGPQTNAQIPSSFCGICFSEKTYPNNELLTCSHCGLIVHELCYYSDAVHLVARLHQQKKQKTNIFTCVVCQTRQQPNQLKCAICQLPKGALLSTTAATAQTKKKQQMVVPVKQKKWCHVVCANWIPEVMVEFPTINLDMLHQGRKQLKCVGCGLRGVCIQCSGKRCTKAYHIYCALRLPQTQVFTGIRQEDQAYSCFCPNHMTAENQSLCVPVKDPRPMESFYRCQKCSSLVVDRQLHLQTCWQIGIPSKPKAIGVAKKNLVGRKDHVTPSKPKAVVEKKNVTANAATNDILAASSSAASPSLPTTGGKNKLKRDCTFCKQKIPVAQMKVHIKLCNNRTAVNTPPAPILPSSQLNEKRQRTPVSMNIPSENGELSDFANNQQQQQQLSSSNRKKKKRLGSLSKYMRKKQEMLLQQQQQQLQQAIPTSKDFQNMVANDTANPALSCSSILFNQWPNYVKGALMQSDTFWSIINSNFYPINLQFNKVFLSEKNQKRNGSLEAMSSTSESSSKKLTKRQLKKLEEERRRKNSIGNVVTDTKKRSQLIHLCVEATGWSPQVFFEHFPHNRKSNSINSSPTSSPFNTWLRNYQRKKDTMICHKINSNEYLLQLYSSSPEELIPKKQKQDSFLPYLHISSLSSSIPEHVADASVVDNNKGNKDKEEEECVEAKNKVRVTFNSSSSKTKIACTYGVLVEEKGKGKGKGKKANSSRLEFNKPSFLDQILIEEIALLSKSHSISTCLEKLEEIQDIDHQNQDESDEIVYKMKVLSAELEQIYYNNSRLWGNILEKEYIYERSLARHDDERLVLEEYRQFTYYKKLAQALITGYGKPKISSGYEEGTCVICFDGTSTEKNAIVFCDLCNIAVHQCCYGVINIPEGDYHCDKCKFNVIQQDNEEVVCILCPITDGAFKRTATNQWIHVVCALWSPCVYIQDLPNLSQIFFSANKAMNMGVQFLAENAKYVQEDVSDVILGKQQMQNCCEICNLSTGYILECNLCKNRRFHFLCGWYHASIQANVTINPKYGVIYAGGGKGLVFSFQCASCSKLSEEEQACLMKLRLQLRQTAKNLVLDETTSSKKATFNDSYLMDKCCACFLPLATEQQHIAVSTRKKKLKGMSTMAIQCCQCGIRVHAGCLPDFQYTKRNMVVFTWQCEACLKKVKKPSCSLCLRTGGYLMATQNQTWTHLYCAQRFLFLAPTPTPTDATLPAVPSFFSSPMKESVPKKKICHFCQRKQGYIVCCNYRSNNHRSCSVSFHVMCGAINKCYIKPVKSITFPSPTSTATTSISLKAKKSSSTGIKAYCMSHLLSGGVAFDETKQMWIDLEELERLRTLRQSLERARMFAELCKQRERNKKKKYSCSILSRSPLPVQLVEILLKQRQYDKQTKLIYHDLTGNNLMDIPPVPSKPVTPPPTPTPTPLRTPKKESTSISNSSKNRSSKRRKLEEGMETSNILAVGSRRKATQRNHVEVENKQLDEGTTNSVRRFSFSTDVSLENLVTEEIDNSNPRRRSGRHSTATTELVDKKQQEKLASYFYTSSVSYAKKRKLNQLDFDQAVFDFFENDPDKKKLFESR